MSDSVAYPEDMLPLSCVCGGDVRWSRPEQASGVSGRGRQMEWRDRFALAKQTRTQSAGAASEGRAREAGPPGHPHVTPR